MKSTLQKRMIYYFSITFLIIWIGFGTVMYFYSVRVFKEQSYDYCNEIVSSNIELLNIYFEQLQSISKIITTDKDILKAVTYRNNTNEINYAIELYNQRDVGEKIKQLDVLANIDSAIIVGEDYKSFYYYQEAPDNQYDFGKQKWFTEVLEKRSGSISFTNYHDRDYLIRENNETTISAVTPISNMTQYSISNQAYLICDFNLDPMILSSSDKSNTQITIFDGKNQVYFPPSLRLSELQISELTEHVSNQDENFVIKKDKGNSGFIVVNKKSEISGWSIVGVKPLTEIEVYKVNISTFIIALIIGCGILVIILSGAISKTILIPIKDLVVKFKQIAKGDFDVKFNESSSNEINYLSDTAEYMVRSIIALSDEVLREQQKLSEEQLKVLQHQINPHFINNVLQSIKAMAVNEEVEGISTLTTLFGKVLSYSIYNPYDQVAIITELEYIKQYIQMQNIRFSQKINYSVDCEEKLEMYEIPKLIIQPIVENAIEHGFVNHKNGYLTITVMTEGNEVCIIITDNGAGINEEELDEINQGFTHKDTYSVDKSIGLLNVNQRIKSIYGEKYGIKVMSRLSVSTSVIITLPEIE